MKILVINAGPSSCKYQLFSMDDQSVLCSGVIERIGRPMGKLSHKIAPGTDEEEKIAVERPFPTHIEGMKDVVSLLPDPEKGVIQDKSEISTIGYRVLHGGKAITDPVLIDEKIEEIIRDYFPFGPLHNPANLVGIDVAEKLFPGVPNVGVFDTKFGITLAPGAYLYPLPYSLYEELRTRRYGFHGTSHRYIAEATTTFLGKPLSELGSIAMRLGNDSSMNAVQSGKCIGTSMGLTPLEGLIMGTHYGSIGPAIAPFMMGKKGMTSQETDTVLSKQSGLLSICGANDMYDIHANIEKGDGKAVLAFKMLARSTKKVPGSYLFLLGNVDSIVFTAGIGENDEFVCETVCEGLEPFDIKVDKKENRTRKPGVHAVSTPDSRIPVLTIPTNGKLEITTTTMRVVGESQK